MDLVRSSLAMALFISPSAHLRRSGPDGQLVRQAAPEDFRRQIPPSGTAERTADNDSRIGHRLKRRRNVLSAAHATNGVFEKPILEQVEHSDSIGEYKANIQLASLARSGIMV